MKTFLFLNLIKIIWYTLYIGPVILLVTLGIIYTLSLKRLEKVHQASEFWHIDQDSTFASLIRIAIPNNLMFLCILNLIMALSLTILIHQYMRRLFHLNLTIRQALYFVTHVILIQIIFSVASLVTTRSNLPRLNNNNLWGNIVLSFWVIHCLSIVLTAVVAIRLFINRLSRSPSIVAALFFNDDQFTVNPTFETGCGCICCSPNGKFKLARDRCEERASFWKKITFSWVTPLVTLGHRRPLTFGDLFIGADACDVDKYASKFYDEWRKQKSVNSMPSLWRIAFRSYAKPLLFCGCCRILGDTCNFAGPLLVGRITMLLQRVQMAYNTASDSNEANVTLGSLYLQGIGFVALLAVSNTAKTLLENAYWFGQTKQAISLRSAIQAVLYDKTLRVNLAALPTQALLDDSDERKLNQSFTEEETVNLPLHSVSTPVIHPTPPPTTRMSRKGNGGFTKLFKGEGQDQPFGSPPTSSAVSFQGSTQQNWATAFKIMSSAEDSIESSQTVVTSDVVRDDQNRRRIPNDESVTHGRLLNLMSTDADRVFELWNDLQNLWCCSYVAIACVVLLWLRLGIAMIGGVLVMLCTVPITSLLVRRLKRVQQMVMNHRDRRIKATNEMFGGIRVIKLYAWELPFKQRLFNFRKEELVGLKGWQSFVVLQWFTWSLVPILVAVVAFALYCALLKGGQGLDPATAFTALALFNMLRWPLSLYPRIISLMADAVVSFPRLMHFLSLPEVEVRKLDERTVEDDEFNRPTIICQHATVKWPSRESTLLEDITFSCYPGSLTVIVGRTGVGKTSLISTLLGDLPPTISCAIRVTGRLAYVGQTPWLMTGTVRDNITFGRPFCPRWYAKVIHACALLPDLDILPRRDLTEIGEKGVTLSGGQRQRIAIARAAYRATDESGPNSSVYLLDDCLSAVDSQVASHIFNRCFMQLLRNSGATIVLVTHKMDILNYADRVIYMEKRGASGFIAAQGSHTELLQRCPQYILFTTTEDGTTLDSNRLAPHLSESITEEDNTEEETSSSAAVDGSSSTSGLMLLLGEVREESSSFYASSSRRPEDSSSAIPPITTISASATDIQQDACSATSLRTTSTILIRRLKGSNVILSDEALPVVSMAEKTLGQGRVSLRILNVYLKALGGVKMLLLILLALATASVAQISSGYWIAYWTDHGVPGLPTGTLVFALLGLTQLGMLTLSIWLTAKAAVRASQSLHSQLIDRLIRAPILWFNVTPLGDILSRCSRDLFTVDQVLPNTWRMYLLNVFSVGSVFVVITWTTPMFTLVCIPIAVAYWAFQSYYIPGATQLRRLDMTSRAPILALYSETLEGVATIRAYGESQRFSKQHRENVAGQARAVYPNTAFHRWLTVRIEALGALIIVTAAALTVLKGLSATETVVRTAGTGALAISYALSITYTLTFMVRTTSDLQTDLVAVERLQEYIENTESEAVGSVSPSCLSVGPRMDPHEWPSKGRITFINLNFRYRPHLPLVLNNVNLEIAAGEKVGIVGRTGAGKSSLLAALLRLVEFESGSIVIDNVSIATLGLWYLRSRFAIIPQDPVLFNDTLRFNVDPLSESTDEEVAEALQCAHLGSLATTDLMLIEEGGRNLSQGQRQLVCLARALLRRSKILLLDEATSAVDPLTDKLIQETIATKFAHCTVLTIAHRLQSVLSCDRVLVMDAGEPAEFDTPQNLITRPNGIFKSLCANAGIKGLSNPLVTSSSAAQATSLDISL